MNYEQLLLAFEKTKENVGRLITAIIPARNIHAEAGKDRIAGEVKDGSREPHSISGETVAIDSQRAFELEGVQGLITKEADALLVAASMARYKFAVKNGYFSDIGAGLYTLVTQNKGLYDVREAGTKDPTTGKFEARAARIILSRDVFFKAAFGPLVDDNGRAISAEASEIIKEAKNQLIPILEGQVAMPRAYASIQKQDKQTGKMLSAVIEGEPVRIYRVLAGVSKKEIIVVDLDYFFWPAIERGKEGFQTHDLFLHQVAGLTSFLQLGTKLYGKGKKQGIEVTNARKIILAAQAAYELRFFAPGIVRENTSGRVNIALRRNTVKDLYPSAIDTTGRIRFKAFSDAVALAGQYFAKAIEATGIMDELKKKDGKVIIPAQAKGAEFPENLPQIVNVKADKVRQMN